MRPAVAVGLLRVRLHPLARAERALLKHAAAVKPGADWCSCERCSETRVHHWEASAQLHHVARRLRERWKACLQAPDPSVHEAMPCPDDQTLDATQIG